MIKYILLKKEAGHSFSKELALAILKNELQDINRSNLKLRDVLGILYQEF